jgi:hypothetical protein
MGQVAELASKQTLDEAWRAYRDHAARSFDDRRLILDRGYMGEWARLEARFKRLSLLPRVY